MNIFRKRSVIPAPAQTVFEWHARPGAFERLTPPADPVRLLVEADPTEAGALAVLEVGFGPLRVRWEAHHEQRGALSFTDTQIRGPFAFWEHTHSVRRIDAGQCVLEDRIEWALPGGRFGALFDRWVTRKLTRLFRWRHRVTADEIQRHLQSNRSRTMKIAVTGARGLIGTQLSSFLTTGGHDVLRLVRDRNEAKKPDALYWNPDTGEIDAHGLEGVDAVIHLAGAGIADQRWTTRRKDRIQRSRVVGTALLANTLAGLERKPAVFISASATGYYGDRADEWLSENVARGSGFLADVCDAWEKAAQPARDAGIRVVHPRLGIVLSPRGGALAKTLTPFKIGLGGPIGSGQQYWSWIAIDDVVAALHHLLNDDALEGPVNLVAPETVTNREFTKTLGAVLRRPTLLPVPAFGIRLLLGEMADELLLSSARVRPSKLEERGFRFSYPHLHGAFQHLLGTGDVHEAAQAPERKAA